MTIKDKLTMMPFKKYVICKIALFPFYSITSPVLFTIEWVKNLQRITLLYQRG